MRFPLADWIDEHRDCRHNLGSSGMAGSIRRPAASDRSHRRPSAEELTESLGRSIGVDPNRIFLTHGATEANAWVTFYVARRPLASRACRVRFPEYPPLFDVAREAGFDVRQDELPAGLAVVSQPRNPEGDLWPVESVVAWADGATHLLIDETFREFARTPSFATASRPRLWTTGSFTKLYGADDLRVGFVVAPPEEVEGFGRFAGLVADGVPDRSVAGALELLERRERIFAQVDRILGPNRAVLHRAIPEMTLPRGPVGFDRVRSEDGDQLARRCLGASILVCPGSLFGDRGGVRIGLTRRSFPADLAAYLRVRNGPAGRTTGRAGRGR
jgi:histidinol-phosphate/aromatic aminotransferase/cobyric acid decarboxylase-like protein